MALRALHKRNAVNFGPAHSRERERKFDVPFRWFAHPFDDPVQSLLSPFFDSLGNRLRTLFVSRILEETGDEMIKGHLAVLVRPMFQDWK